MATDTLPEMGFFDKHRAKIIFAGPGECWLWSAARTVYGYGTLKARGKMRLAHREAYEVEHGEGSASGMVVRHRCDTPACVNPAHLEIGTHADNIRDKMERGRQKCGGVKGEAHGCAKLTEADVRAIRLAYSSGGNTHGQRAIARRFGVSKSQIGRIISRETWSHVA